MVSQICLIIGLSIVLVSCSENKNRPETLTYYPSGILRLKKVKVDSTTYEYESYFENGNIRERGAIVNGLKEGFHEEFYSDGTILWKGNYTNGLRLYNDLKYTPEDCSVEFRKKISDTVYIEAKIKNIHPSDFAVGSNNGKIYYVVDSLTRLTLKTNFFLTDYNSEDSIRLSFYNSFDKNALNRSAFSYLYIPNPNADSVPPVKK